MVSKFSFLTFLFVLAGSSFVANLAEAQKKSQKSMAQECPNLKSMGKLVPENKNLVSFNSARIQAFDRILEAQIKKLSESAVDAAKKQAAILEQVRVDLNYPQLTAWDSVQRVSDRLRGASYALEMSLDLDTVKNPKANEQLAYLRDTFLIHLESLSHWLPERCPASEKTPENPK